MSFECHTKNCEATRKLVIQLHGDSNWISIFHNNQPLPGDDRSLAVLENLIFFVSNANIVDVLARVEGVRMKNME